jgi:hypothetical protein
VLWRVIALPSINRHRYHVPVTLAQYGCITKEVRTGIIGRVGSRLSMQLFNRFVPFPRFSIQSNHHCTSISLTTTAHSSPRPTIHRLGPTIICASETGRHSRKLMPFPVQLAISISNSSNLLNRRTPRFSPDSLSATHHLALSSPSLSNFAWIVDPRLGNWLTDIGESRCTTAKLPGNAFERLTAL